MMVTSVVIPPEKILEILVYENKFDEDFAQKIVKQRYPEGLKIDTSPIVTHKKVSAGSTKLSGFYSRDCPVCEGKNKYFPFVMDKQCHDCGVKSYVKEHGKLPSGYIDQKLRKQLIKEIAEGKYDR